MPQYKYAAGVRNPQQHMASQPQVAMQQVRFTSFIRAGRPNKPQLYTSIFQSHDCTLTCNLCLIQPAVLVQGQEPLTASMLASAPPQEQKQMLGQLHVVSD